jgi:hypothetical protein
MGRTLLSATQLILNEQSALARFRRALVSEDKPAFDALFRGVHQRVQALSYAAHLLPFEMMLLSMLIEEHRQIQDHQRRLQRLEEALQELSGESRTDNTLVDLSEWMMQDEKETQRLDRRRLSLVRGNDALAD